MSSHPKNTNSLRKEGECSIIFTNLSKYVKVADIEGHVQTLKVSSFDIEEIVIDKKTKKRCCKVNFQEGINIRKIIRSKHRSLGVNVSVIIQDKSQNSNTCHDRLPSILIVPANISSQKKEGASVDLTPRTIPENEAMVLVEFTDELDENEVIEGMTEFGKVEKIILIEYSNKIYKYCVAFGEKESAKNAIKKQFIQRGDQRLRIQKFTPTDEKGSLTGVSTGIGGSSNTRKASNIQGEISPGFEIPKKQQPNNKNRQRQYSEVLQLPSPNACLAARRNFKVLTPTLKEKESPKTVSRAINKYKLCVSKGPGLSFNNFGFYENDSEKKKVEINKECDLNRGEEQKREKEQEQEKEEDSPFLKSSLLKKFYSSRSSSQSSNPQEENGVLVNQNIQPFEKNQPLEQQYWVSNYDSSDIRFN